MLQSAFRGNTSVIGIALADALGGSARRPSAKDMLARIAKNPVIDSILLGMLCVVIQIVPQKYWGQVVFPIQENLRFLYWLFLLSSSSNSF